MKLYRISTTSGLRWFGTQADAKAATKELGGEYHQIEVPVDKPNLLAWLNDQGAGGDADQPQVPDIARHLDPLQQAELRAVTAARGSAVRYDYQALDARSSLAAMDAGMISRQIEQLHGPDLGKIVAACVKRISDLAAAGGINVAGS